MNKAAVNMCIRGFGWRHFFSESLRRWQQDHMAVFLFIYILNLFNDNEVVGGIYPFINVY